MCRKLSLPHPVFAFVALNVMEDQNSTCKERTSRLLLIEYFHIAIPITPSFLQPSLASSLLLTLVTMCAWPCKRRLLCKLLLIPRYQTHLHLLPCNLLLSKMFTDSKRLFSVCETTLKKVCRYLHTCLSLRFYTVVLPALETHLIKRFPLLRDIVFCGYIHLKTQNCSHFIFSSVALLEKAAVIIYSSNTEKDLSHIAGKAWDEIVWDLSSWLIDDQLLFLVEFSAIAHSQII